MSNDDLQALGLYVTEKIVRNECLHEVRADIYSRARRDLIAYFSATVRTSDGAQVLNTSSQFIQRNYLSLAQIDAVTQWLRDSVITARWRLTTYTTVEEVQP